MQVFNSARAYLRVLRACAMHVSVCGSVCAQKRRAIREVKVYLPCRTPHGTSLTITSTLSFANGRSVIFIN